MKINLFEFDSYGDIWIEFEIQKSWESFLFIAEIIENKIGAKVIKKIGTIGNLYEKNNFKFELAYDLDYGTCLKLLEDRNRNDDTKNYELLRSIANEIVDNYFLKNE